MVVRSVTYIVLGDKVLTLQKVFHLKFQGFMRKIYNFLIIFLKLSDILLLHLHEKVNDQLSHNNLIRSEVGKIVMKNIRRITIHKGNIHTQFLCRIMIVVIIESIRNWYHQRYLYGPETCHILI